MGLGGPALARLAVDSRRDPRNAPTASHLPMDSACGAMGAASRFTDMPFEEEKRRPRRHARATSHFWSCPVITR